jgi:hypothetical protein
MIRNLIPRLAEAGKIKIGTHGPERKSAKGAAFRPPVKLDHFLVTTTTRNEAGDLELDAGMMEAIGTDTDGKIRAIPIVLHSDNIDEVFPTSYALYSGKRCACRGDGETAIRRELDKDKRFTGAEKTRKCPCEYLNAESGPKCKPNGKLFCSIAATGSAVAGAVHVWRTTSIISIQQMIGSLMQIKAITGTLRGIPLWLRVKPLVVEPAGSGPITVYVCHAELRAKDIAEVQRAALDAAKVRRELGFEDDEYRRMIRLPAHDESLDEQAEVAEEFYPENEPAADGRGTSPAELAARVSDSRSGGTISETNTTDDGRKPGDLC